MTVVRYEPFSLVNRLSRDLDRLFLAQFDGDDETGISAVDWVPAVDIREEPNQFVLRADVPGVDPKDIEVTMEKGVLTIRGRRESEERKENGNGWRRVERAHGEFCRRISLPDGADPESVRAKYVNGVLEVVIPKQATVLPRRIDVATH